MFAIPTDANMRILRVEFVVVFINQSSQVAHIYKYYVSNKNQRSKNDTPQNQVVYASVIKSS